LLHTLKGDGATERSTKVIDMEEPAEHHHFLVQAPVPPVDVDGLAVLTVGTAIFGLVSVVLAFAYDWLAAHGHAIWLQVSVSGFVLGLIGLAYCWNRRRRRRAAGG
jgi:Protein of unknown function (DUF2530)